MSSITPKLVLAAVKQDGSALKYAAEVLQADREIVLAAVKQHGSVLEYAAAGLQADREIVLAAVKRFGLAIWYASGALRTDPKLRSWVGLTRAQSLWRKLREHCATQAIGTWWRQQGYRVHMGENDKAIPFGRGAKRARVQFEAWQQYGMRKAQR